MRTRSPGNPPVTNVTKPPILPTPWPFSRRSSRTTGSRARVTASGLAAPLFVKGLEELIGFVDQRAYAVARRILRGLFEQRADEPIRAKRRGEEGDGPHPWVRAPEIHLALLRVPLGGDSGVRRAFPSVLTATIYFAELRSAYY